MVRYPKYSASIFDMSVKVGNIVTDEGSVREVLSVDDAENLISTMSTSSSDVATNGSVAVATFGDGKGVVYFTEDTSYSRLLGIYVDTDGKLKAFRYSDSNNSEIKVSKET